MRFIIEKRNKESERKKKKKHIRCNPIRHWLEMQPHYSLTIMEKLGLLDEELVELIQEKICTSQALAAPCVSLKTIPFLVHTIFLQYVPKHVSKLIITKLKNRALWLNQFGWWEDSLEWHLIRLCLVSITRMTLLWFL